MECDSERRIPLSTVVIIGEGMLADMVCRRLSGFSAARRSDFSEGIPDGAELVLVLQEQDNSDLHLEADAALRPLGIPWLCAYVFLGEGVVGPLMRPERPDASNVQKRGSHWREATAKR